MIATLSFLDGLADVSDGRIAPGYLPLSGCMHRALSGEMYLEVRRVG